MAVLIRQNSTSLAPIPFSRSPYPRGIPVTRRLFRCSNCGHRLRFGAPVCGKCYHPTPMANRRLTYWLALLLIPLLGLVVLAS